MKNINKILMVSLLTLGVGASVAMMNNHKDVIVAEAAQEKGKWIYVKKPTTNFDGWYDIYVHIWGDKNSTDWNNSKKTEYIGTFNNNYYFKFQLPFDSTSFLLKQVSGNTDDKTKDISIPSDDRNAYNLGSSWDGNPNTGWDAEPFCEYSLSVEENNKQANIAMDANRMTVSYAKSKYTTVEGFDFLGFANKAESKEVLADDTKVTNGMTLYPVYKQSLFTKASLRLNYSLVDEVYTFNKVGLAFGYVDASTEDIAGYTVSVEMKYGTKEYVNVAFATTGAQAAKVLDMGAIFGEARDTTEVTARVKVTKDTSSIYMNEKTFSVKSLATYYVDHATELELSESDVAVITALKNL